MQSLLKCYDSDAGHIDIIKYVKYKKSANNELTWQEYLMIIAVCAAISREEMGANGDK